MRKLRWLPVLGLIGALALLPTVTASSATQSASSSLVVAVDGGITINTFTNDTGGAVQDLHIIYNTPITAVTQSGTPFGTIDNIGTNTIELGRSSPLPAGTTPQITATGQANRTRISQWWWTLGEGHQVGNKHQGCVAPSCTSP